jgi:hypothetical protein
MKRALLPLQLLCFVASPGLATSAEAVIPGQIDDFEDGTTQGWVVALGGTSHPAPPVNIPGGGPGGADDNYLLLTAVGGAGSGSRLTVINLSQWAGNYLSADISTIRMNLGNFSPTDLFIRLLFEDPMSGPPANVAITTAVAIPAGIGWVPATFSIHPADLIPLKGDAEEVLSNTTALRIFHSLEPEFPPDPVVAQLGVDNIEAVAGPTPTESMTWGRIKSTFK